MSLLYNTNPIPMTYKGIPGKFLCQLFIPMSNYRSEGHYNCLGVYFLVHKVVPNTYIRDTTKSSHVLGPSCSTQVVLVSDFRLHLFSIMSAKTLRAHLPSRTQTEKLFPRRRQYCFIMNLGGSCDRYPMDRYDKCRPWPTFFIFSFLVCTIPQVSHQRIVF